MGFVLQLGLKFLQYTTRQAANAAAKRYGGKVLSQAAAKGKKAVDASSKQGLKIIKDNRKGAKPPKKAPNLKADPKKAPEDVKARAATKPDSTKKSVTGDKAQRGLIVAATTIPMFMDTKSKKDGKVTSSTSKTSSSYKPGNAGAKRKAQTAAMEKELKAKALKARSAISKTNKSKSSASKLSKFEQAFADARAAGKKTFTFKRKSGKTDTFTTERKDKKPMSKKRG